MSSSPDPELMQLFDFSVTDLRANREGKITSYQTERLRENLSDNWFALGCLPVVGFMCFLCFIPMTIKAPENAEPLTIPILIGGGLLITVGIIVFCIYAIRRSSTEANNPRVHSIQGQMRVNKKQQKDAWGFYTRIYVPILQIAHVEFSLKPSQYKGLSERIPNDKGEIYVVYYTEKTKTILSIEVLS